jgi:hypothetical protein
VSSRDPSMISVPITAAENAIRTGDGAANCGSSRTSYTLRGVFGPYASTVTLKPAV